VTSKSLLLTVAGLAGGLSACDQPVAYEGVRFPAAQIELQRSVTGAAGDDGFLAFAPGGSFGTGGSGAGGGTGSGTAASGGSGGGGLSSGGGSTGTGGSIVPLIGPTIGDPNPGDCQDTGCSQPFNPCYIAICNPTSGQCEIKANDGATCDDGNQCTLGDYCREGNCVPGTPRTCPPLSQCHEAGTCTNGACQNPPKPNGTTCTDSNACTQTDTCQNGACAGGNPVVCTAQDQCHDPGTCNTATGTCSNPIKPNGATCTDNNACSRTDTCQNGACSGGNLVVCTAMDQCHDVGTCNPSNGICSNPAKINGALCNDARMCTMGDRCIEGICTGTVTCPALDQCHSAGTCDAMGACTTPNKPNGTPCNDTSMCTMQDTCMNGACRGGTAVTCPTPDQCHDPGVCNDNTGQCSNPVKPTGTACNDNMLCTYGDACNAAGGCAGTMVTCTSDELTIRECDGTATCKITPRPGAACDDNNPCTTGDVRRSDGSCAGTPYTCEVTACLSAAACDGRGGCIPTARPDGTACDADQSKCTPHDRCQGGVCVRDPSPVACVKRDCFTVACNPTTGNCDYQPTSGDMCGVTGCFTTGTCSAGVCSGVPRDCSSFDGPCTVGICDARTGGCAAEYKPNGSSCDPGGMCAGGAVCAFGICQLPPATCEPSASSCKVPACDPSSGDCFEMNLLPGTACDPKVSCMTTGVCNAQGACIGSPAPNGESCTRPGGAIGLCVTGSCVTTDVPDAGLPDAAGGSDASRTQRSADGCGCDVAPARGSLVAALALLALAAVAWRRRPTPRKQKQTRVRSPR
jgi:MYXO-CTERM domain-containing protein